MEDVRLGRKTERMLVGNYFLLLIGNVKSVTHIHNVYYFYDTITVTVSEIVVQNIIVKSKIEPNWSKTLKNLPTKVCRCLSIPLPKYVPWTPSRVMPKKVSSGRDAVEVVLFLHFYDMPLSRRAFIVSVCVCVTQWLRVTSKVYPTIVM